MPLRRTRFQSICHTGRRTLCRKRSSRDIETHGRGFSSKKSSGFVRRHTVEMNMDKVETVNVDQSILGRILGYGTIHVLGTGQGIEGLSRIAAPIAVRNAITAR